MQICKNCLIPDTRPDQIFTQGVCNACIFFDALASGIPFFVILKDNNYMFKDDLNKLFNELLDKNIWFKNSADCSNFINANYCNISQFWQSQPVQHLISKLKIYFFYYNKNNF